MMQVAVVVMLILSANSALAAQGFDGVTGRSLILGVDDCSATKLLNKAISESGVNPLDSTPSAVGTCSCAGGRPKCDGTAKELSLYLSCSEGDSIKCFADTPSKLPALCITNPRSVTLDKHYADAGDIKDVRARFSALHVIRKTGSGDMHSPTMSWNMDSNGCEPTSAFLGNPIDSPDKCMALIRNYVTGGYIYSPSISKKKFADGDFNQDNINAIGRLHDCTEAYPQLRYASTYQTPARSTEGTGTKDGNSKATTQK